MCIRDSPCIDFSKEEYPWTYDGRISLNGSQYVVESGYGDHPVGEVTWYGADAFCSYNSRRLPTEAEWEKAARGTEVRAYPWGDQAPSCDLINFNNSTPPDPANYCVGDTVSIGSYPLGASHYGVMDMAGNVLEWVSDWYSETVSYTHLRAHET